jgi:UDP-glucuronate 4-epimerase
MKKNILVTGGAGFIGSHLVDNLLENTDANVCIVDNFNDFYSPAVKLANLGTNSEHPRLKIYQTDICDQTGLREVFSAGEFDAVVHLAAYAGVRPSLMNPKLYTEVNVCGTLNLLELANEFDVGQFVFGSSSSVYGIDCKIPFSEEDKIQQPISPYAATKAAGELMCHTFSHLYDIRTVCLRFFTVYGARQRPDLAIHKFSKLIYENKPIPVFGDGTTRRDYTYVDDIVQGVKAAIDYDKTNYEVFNLGESETIELTKLIELLEESLGKKAIINRQPMQPGDVPMTYADISKARELLDYNPKTKIEDGIPKFVEWFLENREI